MKTIIGISAVAALLVAVPSLSGVASAARLPSAKEIARALGLRAGQKVDTKAIEAARSRLKQRLGHVRVLPGNRLDATYFQRAKRLWPQARPKAARKAKPRRARPPADKVLGRLGRMVRGRVTLKDFRGRKRLFTILDVQGKGYLTAADVEQAMRGPRLRWKAAQFLKKLDTDRNWALSKAELKNAQFFAKLDSDRNGSVTLGEVLAYLTGRRDRRRQRRRGRAPAKRK